MDRRDSRKPEWLYEDAQSNPAGSLDGDQFTLIDRALTSNVNNQTYSGGVVEGLMLNLQLFPVASALKLAPEAVVMLIPTGMAVPAVTTESQRQNAARWIWYWRPFEVVFQGGVITALRCELVRNVGTRRRFDEGDRIVVVIVSPVDSMAGGAMGASALVRGAIEAYVRED